MLQVSVETLRRWEREGRIRVERSAGGQRLVPLSEVTRLAAERRASGGERPTVARSARNTFAGIVTRVEVGPGRRGRRGPGRPASPRQPDDRRGGPRARPQGRRRGGVRRQGDQRDRRDPRRAQGVTLDAIRLILIAVPGRARRRLLERRCVDGAVRRIRRPSPPSVAPSAAAAVDLTVFGAASLAKVLDEVEGRLRGGQPGLDADHLDRLVRRPRDADHRRRAGRRLPVGRHDEPAEARRRRPGRR